MAKTLTFLLLAIAWHVHAQTTRFQHLTIEDGLSQGMIFDLRQTRDGFLWVATKDGLNRYDGYNFKVFANDPFDPFSVAENTAISLFEDSRGWLWVGLESKGLDVFDPRTGRFHHFPLSLGDNNTFGGSNIIGVRETPDGAIWAIKSGGSLLRIVIPSGWKDKLPDAPILNALTRVEAVPLPATALQDSIPTSLTDISIRSNGELLVVSYKGLFLVEPKTLAVKPIYQDIVEPSIPRFVAGDEKSDGDWWMLRVHDPTQLNELRRIRHGQMKKYSIPGTSWKWPHLKPGKDGNVWFMVDNKMWDLSPGEDFDYSKPDFRLEEAPTSPTYDRNGNFWVGTNGYGLRKLNPVQALFHAGAAGTSMRGVWANGGRYFVKSLFDIRHYDPKTDKIADSPAFPDAPVRNANIVFEPDGALWLLCTQSEHAKGMLRRYPPGNTQKADRVYEFEASMNLFDPMMRSADGKIWLVVNQGRLVRFDPANGQFTYFDFGHLFGEKLNAMRALSLAQDGNGAFWIGTQSGLVKGTPNVGRVQNPADVQSFDFQLFQASADNRKGLNNNVVTHVLPDPAEPGKTLWIATKGGGINIFDIQTGECRHVTTADGLLNNVVYGILPAGQSKLGQPKLGGNLKLPPTSDGATPRGQGGEFWCSTNRGLAKLIRRANGEIEITTFTAALGLQDNEFNTYAFCKTDQGELLFGGVNGLNRFFPEQLRPATTPPPVFIVGLEINHEKNSFGNPGSPLTQPLETLRELRLRHDQNNLSFEFAALDFTDPSKNRYRYQLVGLDKNWVETGNLRFAHFNHLSPGTYEFRVQGSNGESAWADAANSLTIIILPPWWRSKLAYLCYFLLLAWAGWRAVKFQIQRVKEREQLAFEHREIERVRALEQVKTNFFNNVTHEFRTPLTLMQEPLRLALPKIKDPEALENVRLAERNSRKLLGLVNQLLDMAKIESGSMTLDLRLGDFGQTVRDVFEPFLPLAEKKNVRLTLVGERAAPAFEFDADKVGLVLNNLISNALKFTPEGGRVALHLNHGDF